MTHVRLTKPRLRALRYLDGAKLAQCQLALALDAVPWSILTPLVRGGYAVVEEPGRPPRPVVAVTNHGRRALTKADKPRVDKPALLVRARIRLRQLLEVGLADKMLGCINNAAPKWQRETTAALCALPQALRAAGFRRPVQVWGCNEGCVVAVHALDRVPVAVMHPKFVATRGIYGWLASNTSPASFGLSTLVTPARWRYYVSHDGNTVMEARPRGNQAVDERVIMDSKPGRGWCTAEQEGV